MVRTNGKATYYRTDGNRTGRGREEIRLDEKTEKAHV